MLIGVIAEELLGALAVTDRTARVADDIFRLHRIYQVGFVAPSLVDETDIFGEEKLPTTYVTQDYLGIFPDLFDDTIPETETFYDFTSSDVPVLSPDIWRDFDFIWSPDLAIKAISPAGVFIDHDIIYSPTLLGRIFPALVVDDDIIRAQIIRRDGDDYVLLTEVFNDADTVFVATMATGLLPGVVNEHFPTGDLIHAPSQSVYLRSGAFSPGDTFFAAFVFNQLNPGRVANDDLLISPKVLTPGRMGLFVDDDIVFASDVKFGALSAPLLTSDDAFLSPVIGDIPPIWPFDEIVDHEDTFYEPIISIGLFLTPHTWTDVDNILSVPAVVLGQLLAPTVSFDDVDAFYVPVLPPILTPDVFAPADSFFTPALIFDQALTPDWFIDTDTFFVPSLAAPAPPTRSAMIAGLRMVFVNPSLSREANVQGTMVNL